MRYYGGEEPKRKGGEGKRLRGSVETRVDSFSSEKPEKRGMWSF